MPLQLDPQSTESLKNVATKLKKNPMVLNSMLNKCGESKNVEKLELSCQPKRIKQQSEQYLSLRERLERVASKNITLPMIQPSTERRQRKYIFNIEKDKVPPIQFAVQIVLNDINKSGIFTTSKETVAEKPTKVKKQMPKSKPSKKPHKNTEAVDEPKKTRQSSKKIKIQWNFSFCFFSFLMDLIQKFKFKYLIQFSHNSF